MKKRGQYKKSSLGTVWFFINLLVGLYFLNSGFNIIPAPFITDSINKIILIIGGILMIFSAVVNMKKNSSVQNF